MKPLLPSRNSATATSIAPLGTEGPGRTGVTRKVEAGAPDAPWGDAETGSRWSIAGRAVSGPLKGRTLAWLPGVMVQWHAWSAAHPDGALEGRPTASE